MFGFKKKKSVKRIQKVTEVSELSEEGKNDLLSMIANKQKELEMMNGEEQSEILDQMGNAFYELGEDDLAIEVLEKSLQAKKSVGDGYKTLLKLYNKKRAEAAKDKDQETLQTYLKKMDLMMQISKDVTRGSR